MHIPTRLGALGAAAALSLTLAACGSTDDSGAEAGSMPGMDHSGSSSTSSAPPPTATSASSAPVGAQHDAADVSFAQQMIVHHQGAVAMAEMATTQSSNPQVKDLAARIRAAQGPEITEMTGWLQAWGAPTPADSPMAGTSGMGASSASSGPMGMMSEEQTKRLQAATGTGFDRLFLQMMTTHHTGAIDMARAEQADGSNPQAIALATSIEASQTAEVAQMGRMLSALGS